MCLCPLGVQVFALGPLDQIFYLYHDPIEEDLTRRFSDKENNPTPSVNAIYYQTNLFYFHAHSNKSMFNYKRMQGGLSELLNIVLEIRF